MKIQGMGVFSKISIILILWLYQVLILAQTNDRLIKVDGGGNDSIDFNKCLAKWNSPAIQARINYGIELNRKGDAEIIIKDSDGNPVSNITVKISQETHDFLFGSKFLYKNAFDNQDKNRRYEDLFNRIFNFATIPIYWYQVEPQEGMLNYKIISIPTTYKIPVDEMIEYCKNHQITMKGHPIVWERSQAPWAPEDQDQLKILYKKRFEQLSENYRESIKFWDVVNEPLNRPVNRVLPDDCTNWSMIMADKYFSPLNKTGINATTRNCWLNFYYEDSPYYLLIKNLQLRGTRIDYIGMQFHLWYGKEFINAVYNGSEITPQHIYMVLDQYSELGLPIHISEITLPLPGHKSGEDYQAALGSNFIKLFFSYKNIESITWWNLTDELARDGKQYMGALTGENLRIKPVYNEIDRLFNQEWKTNLVAESDEKGKVEFRGFYGEYKLTVISGNNKEIQLKMHISKSGNNKLTVII